MSNTECFGTEKTVGVKAYVSLVLILMFFSGVMPSLSELSPSLSWLKAIDFNTIIGKFGALGTLEEGCGTLASNFIGTGGTGPRAAFLIGLSLIPGIMVAFGIIKVAESMGALEAAGKLLTPILRPLMGVPGECAISLVSSLQSTDAGPLTVHDMREANIITEKESLIMTAFQYSGAGCMVNYFVLGSVCIGFLEIPIIIPLIVIILSKYAGSALVRILVGRVIKLDDESEKEVVA